MKSFNRFCIVIILLFLILAASMNVILKRYKAEVSGYYRVEAKDLADRIEETGSFQLSDYKYLTAVHSAADDSLYQSNNPYVIIRARDTLYRVEYRVATKDNSRLIMNIGLTVAFLLLLLVLAFIRRRILKPFNKLTEIPTELAKGNLAVPIPEEKSRFFGKFTWGINLLRESIEESKTRELAMQHDKKMLLLSLSHDLKTPLSSIKLNAKALQKGIYKDEEKQMEVLNSINTRADEIENYVTQITTAARKDFMEFDVEMGEEFLSKILDRITERYAPQMEMTGTEFVVEEYQECLLACDPGRLMECLQNLIENAIKYGDGRRIAIGFDKMDGRKLITVTNTGCKLEKDELPLIFDSFQRGKNAGNVRGSGLGLFICKKLMSQMDGDVYAEIADDEFKITLVTKLA